MIEEQQGGRIFFSNRGRVLGGDDEIELSSVGIDIGSSTTHFIVSKIVLERLDSRYVVADRQALYHSDVLLTPFDTGGLISADRLKRFFEEEYRKAGIDPAANDTGALILTGVASRRANARAIGDIFAAQAGRMVAVSAGDSLETIMAAHGSGAVAHSIRTGETVMNVDMGGGTCKIAVCEAGRVVDRTAIDLGGRIIVFDEDRHIVRMEEAARWLASDLGLDLEIGKFVSPEDVRHVTARMADLLTRSMHPAEPGEDFAELLRLDPLTFGRPIDLITISGGVAEYVYDRESSRFGDIAPEFAESFVARLNETRARIGVPDEGIRATVVGASQYTSQVSGTTIFVVPDEVLPLRNVPVIAPSLPLANDDLRSGEIAEPIRNALALMELGNSDKAVALFVSWDGSASFARLSAFCEGVIEGLAPVLTNNRPVVLAGDGDIGGLIGIHLRDEMRISNPVVSIDGLDLKEFDYIDIGQILDSAGAVPVVIKSLLFPASAALGRRT